MGTSLTTAHPWLQRCVSGFGRESFYLLGNHLGLGEDGGDEGGGSGQEGQGCQGGIWWCWILNRQLGTLWGFLDNFWKGIWRISHGRSLQDGFDLISRRKRLLGGGFPHPKRYQEGRDRDSSQPGKHKAIQSGICGPVFQSTASSAVFTNSAKFPVIMLSEDQKPPCKCPFSGGWEFLATIPTLYMAQNLAFANSVMKGNFGETLNLQIKKIKHSKNAFPRHSKEESLSLLSRFK